MAVPLSRKPIFYEVCFLSRITLDEELAKETDDYMRKLVKKAEDSGKRIRKQSNVYEEIVRKGWEVVKWQNKK
jgi:hypothetical protein